MSEWWCFDPDCEIKQRHKHYPGIIVLEPIDENCTKEEIKRFKEAACK